MTASAWGDRRKRVSYEQKPSQPHSTRCELGLESRKDVGGSSCSTPEGKTQRPARLWRPRYPAAGSISRQRMIKPGSPHGLRRGSLRFGGPGLGIDDRYPMEAACDRCLGEHYMNPRITPPQNRKARAATKSASFSKEIKDRIL